MNEEDDWRADFQFGIQDLRTLKGVVDYAIETWPGSPRRPVEEQEFLMKMKTAIFALITDYNFTYNEHQ